MILDRQTDEDRIKTVEIVFTYDSIPKKLIIGLTMTAVGLCEGVSAYKEITPRYGCKMKMNYKIYSCLFFRLCCHLRCGTGPETLFSLAYTVSTKKGKLTLSIHRFSV
jgi:hypothetical protein